MVLDCHTDVRVHAYVFARFASAFFNQREINMIKRLSTRIAATAIAATMGAVSYAANAATEIQWWHAMGGVNGERVNKIADDFNATQSAYKVVPVYKGNYTETR